MHNHVAGWLTAWMVVSSLQAADSVWTIDPASSRVTFALQATMHKVQGSFTVASGQLRFDPEAGTFSGSVAVDAASGETANNKRDKKMHRTVLLSEQHPAIIFEPRSFRGSLDPRRGGELSVSGTMELLGVRHEVELPVDVWIEGEALGVRASLTVPYVDWGLEDPSVFVLRVAKTVEVEIDLVGRWTAGP